jgi:hypothetical protein
VERGVHALHSFVQRAEEERPMEIPFSVAITSTKLVSDEGSQVRDQLAAS